MTCNAACTSSGDIYIRIFQSYIFNRAAADIAKQAIERILPACNPQVPYHMAAPVKITEERFLSVSNRRPLAAVEI